MPGTGSGDIRLGPITSLSLGRDTPGGAAPKPGQLYRARVEQVDANGGYIVRAGTQMLRLGAGMQLSVGQELLIRMLVGGDGPRFSVVRTLPSARQETGASTPGELVSTLQRMAVRQQPLAGLLARLAAVDTGDPPNPVAALLRASLNSPGDLVQPGQLRDAIRDSGLLLEARLGAATAEPGLFPVVARNDFKLLLWQLLGDDVLDDGFRELLEGLLAHISLRQLRSICQAEEGHFFWSLELPLAWGQRALPVTITLRHERASSAPDEPDSQSWEVAFALDLEPMGAMEVHLYLRGQQISVSIEAEQPATVEALRSELASLERALSLQGLHVDSVVSRPGTGASSGEPVDTFREVSSLGGGG